MQRLMPILKVIKSIEGYEKLDFMILGGSCAALMNNNLNYNDIDFFFETKEDYEKMTKVILQDYIVNADTTNAVTYEKFYPTSFGKRVMSSNNNKQLENKQLQLIKKQFGTVQEHFKTFDINKAKIGIEFKNGKLKLHRDDEGELKVLNFNAFTLQRLSKYKNKGFVLDEDYIMKLLSKVKTLKEIPNYYSGLDVSGETLIGHYLKDESIELIDRFFDENGYNESILKYLKKCHKSFYVYAYDKRHDNMLFRNDNFEERLKNEYPELLI